ncbi:Gfo/Idh/MocA family oxidoreductase [Porifericola rhodea]|uniref:Gfo/Idh/MocA family oxidoreductase n=1 Tax=Porifericola rhodea TaxID=930972 RepID=UPI0026653676|nr:Gfo/Idh/MocA family oxidoreductase [Porifericola rhodea]WKN30531.1 Gfo/Idh/MocA family oxidoreductase [Porifericola rhodea]
MENNAYNDLNSSRRKFIKTTGAAAVGGSFALNFINPQSAWAGINAETLKVGLVGCGGRGTGAANQALKADDNVVITAMADIFPDRLQQSMESLKKGHGKKVQVDEDHQFIGFDAYKKLIASDVDVVLLATPPTFRPDQLTAVVDAGKHVFCEKPMAVDGPGVRKVMEAAQKAKAQKTSLMSGFCWRYHFPKRETFARILDGGVGDIHTIYNTYNTGTLWSKEPQPGWTQMENQMRNWLYYNWISGDHIAEQAVHSLDMMAWALGDEKPVSCVGTGGRQVRTDAKFGNVYDHFAIVYEFEGGKKGYHFSRQQFNCANSYAVEVNGSKGKAIIDCTRNRHEIQADERWRYRGDGNDMYQTEHNELFAAIRKGEPVNDGEYMAQSTMLAIMGRMAAYTGQTITWDEAINSQEKLGPEEYSFEVKYPVTEVAMPGITEFS